MTDDQLRHLTEQIDLIATHTAKLVEGQQRLDRRLTRLEVRVEGMQDDMRGLGDGIRNVWERLDRFEENTAERFSRVDHRLDRLEARWTGAREGGGGGL